jgi:hypothetical protein
MRHKVDRRTVLKGMLGGGAVYVSLPLLDCFLNNHGTALANGAPRPVRFGTWHWGCGVNPQRFFPRKVGTDYDIPEELQPLAPYKQHLSMLSGYNVRLDGLANEPHISAVWTLRTGTAPVRRDEVDAPSLDVLISDIMGQRTRFRSLDMAATGNSNHTYSRRSLSVLNSSDPTPMAVYTRVFGSGFQDPNAAEFKPDPGIMVRQSALAAIKEQRDSLMRVLGANDRQRMDQYFTSMRQVEQQLALQLQKPPPAEACAIPDAPKELTSNSEISLVTANHKLMAQILALALACDQARNFNVVFSDSASTLRKEGDPVTQHTYTHEEPIDDKLQYQPHHVFFLGQAMNGLATFVGALAAIKEGDGTLLDQTLVYAHSDTSFAKVHSNESIPVMLIGKGGGKIRSGVHVAGNGDPITRTGLTVMRAMGVNQDSWGTRSMQTAKVIDEVLV